MTQHDPLDSITDLGWRVIWVEDFDHRVHVVDDISLVLIDPRVERPVAAEAALSLIASPGSHSGLSEAS